MSNKTNIFIIYALLFVATLSACKRKEENPIPVVSAPITQERLIIVLADIHKAETIINNVVEIPKRDSTAQALYAKIYAIHEVTAALVDSSLNMYLREPRAAQKLYEEVSARLTTEESEFLSQAVQPQAALENPIKSQNPPLLPSAK